jgi:hypothetical protein
MPALCPTLSSGAGRPLQVRRLGRGGQGLERGDHGDCFDLDQQVVADQPSDLDGGAGRWLLGVDVLVADLADHGELGGVDQVVGELDDLLEAGPDGLEGGLEVVEHLPRLGTNVT